MYYYAKIRILAAIAFVVSLTLPPFLYSMQWEMAVKVTSDGNPYHLILGKMVYLYRFSDVQSGLLTPFRQALTDTLEDETHQKYSIICDIGDNNSNTPSWESIPFGTYCLRIDDRYVKLTISSEEFQDFWILYNASQTTFTLCDTGAWIRMDPTSPTTGNSWPQEVPVTIQQFLSDGSTPVGQVLRWDGEAFQQTLALGNTQIFQKDISHTLLADQSIYSSEKYNNWNNLQDVTNYHVFSFQGQTQAAMESHFRATQYGITIATHLADTTAYDTAKASIEFKDPWLIDYPEPAYNYIERNRGTEAEFKTRNSPFHPDSGTSYSGDVYKGIFLQDTISMPNPCYALRAPQTFQGSTCVWVFQNWTANGAKATSANNRETPVIFYSGSAVVTANYVVSKPLPPTSLNIAGGDPGDQIQLTWTDNPNQYVTKYMICRSPDKNEPFVLVDSVNSGIETWTDPYYTITAGYTDLLVGYVVLAKYVHEGFVSLSDSASVHTYGELTPPPKVETAQATGTLTPTEYAVGSYPNPFNPWTIIRFELVEPAEVLLEIYDVMGRRVAVLVDAARSAGSHSTAWHATDDGGTSLASGMYLYRFSAKPTSGGKPYVKTGKLVYAK